MGSLDGTGRSIFDFRSIGHRDNHHDSSRSQRTSLDDKEGTWGVAASFSKDRTVHLQCHVLVLLLLIGTTAPFVRTDG